MNEREQIVGCSSVAWEALVPHHRKDSLEYLGCSSMARTALSLRCSCTGQAACPTARNSKIVRQPRYGHPNGVRCQSFRPVQDWCTGLAAAALSLALIAPSAEAEVVQDFNTKCLGCHYQGGNVLQAGATLFEADLQKNGVASPDALYKIIYQGKGKMPGFGKDCAPKGQCTFGPRLTEQEVESMTAYVLERASQGWK